jgi:hypothetical protein
VFGQSSTSSRRKLSQRNHIWLRAGRQDERDVQDGQWGRMTT